MEETMDIRLQPWSRRLLSTALLFHLCLAGHVHAQPRFEGEGRVVAVDEANGTVTLDHGAIPGLMPAMRMAFPVQQGELLRGLQEGDVVRFSLQARGPEWVIATIEKAEGRLPPRPVMFQAPDFTLPTLSGAFLRVADLQGKVVLLNFWATWCVPCRTEMPSIEALYQRYKDRGLEVVAVNLDMLSTASVEAFMQEVGVTFRVGLDPSWSTARAYRVLGLPTTYLIDRAGNVVVREVGARDWLDGVSQLAVEGLMQ
jgi:thiol-disulfide isomerase/thioredoxin